jgi:hypothetical protein
MFVATGALPCNLQQIDQLDSSLLKNIGPNFPCNECKATISSCEPITQKIRLLVTLRWLAGGSHLDLRFVWGLGISTFYADNGVLSPTLQALYELFPMGLPNDDPDKLEDLSQWLCNLSGGYLDGIIMAIEGFGVLTCAPFQSEV